MQTYFHSDQLHHNPRAYLSRGQMRPPQETPERALCLAAACRSMGFEILEPSDFGIAPIQAVHDADYLGFLRSAYQEWKKMPEDWGDEVISNVYVYENNPRRGVLAQAARHLADGSCPVGVHTWQSAYWSAQSAAAAALAIQAGCRQTYSLCRPPGHHARADRAGGFCYLNNAAIAAQVLRREHRRVAILDTDMHHGQGIQDIFYSRADILYVSIHADPTNFYPVVAGYQEERGEAAGVGFNINLPMPHGSTEAVFFEHVGEALQEIDSFKPGALVLALGFDIYKHDPQSLVSVTTDGFERLGLAVGALNMPVVVVQEGGYHLESLAANARAFFSGFLSRRSATL